MNHAIVRLPKFHRISLEDWVEVRPGLFKRSLGELEQYRRECQDCHNSRPVEVIVTNEIWRTAGLDKGICCPDCIEKRLGRTLTLDDLKDCGWKHELLYWLKKFGGA